MKWKMAIDTNQMTLIDSKSKAMHVNELFENGNTPLINAIQQGDFNMVVNLLNMGANIEMWNDYKVDELEYFKICGDMGYRDMLNDVIMDERDEWWIDLVIMHEYLILNGISKFDMFHGSPLLCAILHGHEAIVHLLMGRGADIQVVDELGRNALMYAVENGHLGLIETFIDKIDLYAIDLMDRDIMTFATCHKSVEVCNYLIQYGFEIEESKSSEMRNANYYHFAVMNDHVEMVNYLIELQVADVPYYEHDSQILDNLSLSIIHDKLEIFECLLPYSAPLSRYHAFMNAIRHGRLVNLEILSPEFNLNVFIHHSAPHASTPLEYAVIQNHLPILQYLMDHGANYSKCQNLYKLAVSYQHHEIANYLYPYYHHKITKQTLFDAVECLDMESIQMAINAKIDINSQNKQGKGVIHLAVKAHSHRNSDSTLNNADIEQVINLKSRIIFDLVSKGANINLRDKFGRTALFDGDPTLFDIMYECGADFGVIDKQKRSILHEFAGQNVEIIDKMIYYGANMDQCDVDGTSILMEMIKYYPNPSLDKMIAKLKYLIDMGIDLNVKDKNGANALLYAAGMCNLSLMKLLEENGANLYVKDKVKKNAIDYAKKK
eukprot:NODE_186_length_13589_cov_0.385545.p1 type:complete len:606 gc:universal NODE_186_length_13589_cov_0.385545:10399-12216(+)